MKNRAFKSVLSLILCAALLVGAVPMSFSAESSKRTSARLADFGEISEAYLSDSEARAAEYPNGAMMIVETSADLEMDGFYAIDIFRQGGTAGEARIKLSTVDMSAGYGEDYRLYLSDDKSDEGVDGEKKLYYYESGVPYIARLSDREEYYLTPGEGDEAAQRRDEASEINDSAADSLPHSSDTVLTFADGENSKTVYIETLKKDEVTDDLEFMLLLSEPENCSASASMSGLYTIKENRAKPKAKLELTSTSVNPESDEAYVSVKRTGNLGGYDSFRITTKSDSAEAEKDYVAVAEDLRFIPNVSEIKVPITMLEGAGDGRSFKVELSDASDNVEVLADTASVAIDSKADITQTGAENRKYVTDYTYKVAKYRGYEFVDLSKFHSETCLGDWGDATAKYENNYYRLDYSQGSWKNHAVDAMSPSKISLVGVTSARFCFDNKGGSCSWDDAAVVFSETNPLDDGDRECCWMEKLGSNGTSWGMSNISSSHLDKTITPSDGDKSHDNFIYLAMNKGGFSGNCGVKFHDYNGDADCSFRLNLQSYQVKIIDPEPVMLYDHGELKKEKAITRAMFTDPNKDTVVWTNDATFYRYDTTTITATVDSKYGVANLKGIYICKFDNEASHSSLIPLTAGNLELTPQFLKSYSNYIINNKFKIQPVYEFEKADFTVESYENTKTGVSFKADNSKRTGDFYVDGEHYGKISWSGQDNRGYYDGDCIRFTFTPDQSGRTKTVEYDWRCAKVKSDLDFAQHNTVGSGQETVDIDIKEKYFRVTPLLIDVAAPNQLLVKNPDKGDYTSKGSKYEKKDNGTATVTGYYFKGNGSVQTIDESFENYKPGARLEFTAKPNRGYYAQWTYTDASTHQTKTYRGKNFYYTVQNPFFVNDNIVTLEFIAEGSTGLFNKTSIYSFPLCGSITVPDGTILHPATGTTTVTQPAENAVVYMDGFSGVTDANGNFTLLADPDSGAPAQIPVVGVKASTDITADYRINETHRALVYYNGNYHICDVQLSGTTLGMLMCSFKTDILINTGTSAGVVPKRVEAYSTESGVYGDSITIVTARSVNFNIDFDARNLDGNKPVNFTRWSFISKDGMIRSSADIPIDAGTTRASYAPVVSEKAKPGDHLYVEFYNRSYDSSSTAQYTFYGKFDVGYTFIAANIEKVMSYMPDLGYYDNDNTAETGSDLASTGAHYSKVPSAPGIGPISPLFSIYGFLPVYSDGATGQKDAKTGKDLYCLEIGVQFSVARSQAGGDDASWGTMSVAKQWEKLAGIIAKSPGELVQNMQTSTKITLSVTFAYRLEYYTGDSGERYYVSSLFMLGFNISVKVSIPFTIVAIPCFVYIEVAANNVGYYVNMPNDKTEGYWTSEMLDNDYYSETHGEFTQDFKIEFGVGIGFDGLASIGGHISFNLLSQLSGSSHGKMTAGIKGGVFAQLLFFKVDKTWDIDKWVLLDTDADLASVGANLLSEESSNLFADTKLSELKLAEAEDIYDDTVNEGKDLAATGADAYAIRNKETYAENNTAQMEPVMAKISDTRYLLASARNDDEVKFGIGYYIYDSAQREIAEKGNPIEKLVEENHYQYNDPGVMELMQTGDLVGDVNIIDCGDKLLLVWESCMVDDYEHSSVDEALQSFGIAAVVFDKQSGKFTDFDLVNTGANVLPDQIKGVYNPATGLTHIFYESIDVEDVTGDTTLDQLNKKPLSLNTCAIDLSREHPKFSEPDTIENKGNTISDYDVSVYDGDIMVSYICARENTLTVEKPLTGDTALYANDASYGTVNLMYLNRYAENDSKLNEKNSILIADNNYVTANPEFVKLSYQGDENTLLFYKCNGRYGYQNIENLYIQCAHEGWDQSGEMDSNAMTPSYITVDEDHTVGEDFKVYPGGDGELFALWTLAEGSQQQIWGRQFVVDSVTKNDIAATVDNNGDVMLNDDSTPVTEKLSEPVSILNGYWGNKVRLTSYGNMDDNKIGFYKGAFDAEWFDSDQMLCAYYSYDYDFGGKPEGDELKMINGRFIISEFSISPDFHLGYNGFMDAVTVDNEHPTPGETVKIKTMASNTGFSIARDVTLELMIAGQAEPVATITYPVWLAGEDKENVFEYTVPENWDFEKQEILPYYMIYMDGERMFRSETTAVMTYAPKLSIDLAHADPENYITKDQKTTAYHVTATIRNVGNAPYEGGDELSFIFNDIAAQADVMNKDVPDTDPFYINYGGIRIPEIEAGSKVELSFVSEEIPESIFDKYGTNSANLKLAITPEDGIGWEEVKGEESYCFLDELGIGQFVKPEPDQITSISAEALTVPLGSTRFILPVAAPLSAAGNAEFTFSTKDKNITVDDTGMVRGNDRGTATVTVSCGDVSTDVQITVGPPEVGDVDGDGDITILDATAIQRHLAEVELLDAEAIARGDADRDGELTILDATTIQRYLALLIYAL